MVFRLIAPRSNPKDVWWGMLVSAGGQCPPYGVLVDPRCPDMVMPSNAKATALLTFSF
jgi:hypothetical protein